MNPLPPSPPGPPVPGSSVDPYRDPGAFPPPLAMSPLRKFLPHAFSLLTGIIYGVSARVMFGVSDRPGSHRNDLFGVMTMSFLFGVPVAIGLLYALRFPRGYPVKATQAVGGAVLASLLAVGATMVLAIEGLICVAMATPIFIAMAILGALVGWSIHRSLSPRAPSRPMVMAVAGVLPFLLAPVEHLIQPPVEVHEVANEVRIHASPEAVWREIRSVPRIRPDELPWTVSHTIGLPRPIEATLSDQRVGGVRIATFERGLAFREAVTTWEPGRTLAFGIHAERVPSTALDEHVGVGGDYFDVLDGTYRVEPVGPNEVVLHLASRQRLSMRFNKYAGLWTDFVMHDLQQAILTVVRARAEAHPGG